MSDLKQELEKTMHMLYIENYAEEIILCMSLESKTFTYYLKMDWRFQSFYISYKRKTQSNISIDDFIEKYFSTEIIYNFIRSNILYMPEEIKPKHLYLDDPYPFRFEILQSSFWGDIPSYEDFKINTNAKFLGRLSKMAYHDMTTEEIYKKEISELNFRINLIRERKRKIRAAQKKTKIIYKFDKDNELVKTYNSRRECCEAEGFKRAALSLHLSGKRKSLNGYIYKEIIT